MSKTITKIPTNIIIEFEGYHIKPSIAAKNLGLHTDRFIIFEDTMTTFKKKVIVTLTYLNHIKNKIPTDTRITVVQTLSLSIINYCCNI